MRPEQHIRYLENENRELRADNAALSKLAHERTYHVRRVRRAYEDALLMAIEHCRGVHPSRSYMCRPPHDLSQRRWQNAVALLRMARVIVRSRHWDTDNLDSIEKRLAQTRKRAIEQPEAYRARLNRHGVR